MPYIRIKRRVSEIVCFLLIAMLLLPVIPAYGAGAASGGNTFDFEDGTAMGWQQGNGSNFGTVPVEYSTDLARPGNQGALKVNVSYTGGGWEEAGAKVSLSPANLSSFESISYDIAVPVSGFTGNVKVQTIINWPWTELGTLDSYDIADFAANGYTTAEINGNTYVIIHKTDSLPAAAAQPELLIRLAASGTQYAGPIYIDDVHLSDTTSPTPTPSPITGGTIYEAEDAALIGTVVEQSAPGYSGTGYVSSFDNTGDAVTFTVTVDADGTYPLSVGYRGPYGEKTQDILVNGRTVTQKVFPASTEFKEITAGNVILNAGSNTVTILKSWGWMEVDYIRIGDPVQRPPLQPVPPTLNSPYASTETKALMTYLTQIYGSKVLSGQQTGLLDELNYIHNISGKLPAIAAFDMLEDNSEAGALQWANYGGIVEYSWHWRAPAGGHDFYTNGTTFDIRQAVTPGTAENQLIIQDIDNIAARLKTLSDAKVPVLWRPLHEAEGGWFWWGAHGADPLKQLYRIVYDRLVNVHKLDNLIWVFTSGTSDRSPDWYPGDGYVDIAGMDKYMSAGDYSPLMADFDFLVNMVQGKKLVGFLENGPIPDPVQLQKNKVGWLYFNTWSGYFILDGKTNTEDHIRAVYNDPHVVTLDQLPSAAIYGKPPVPHPDPRPLPTAPPVPDGYTAHQAEDGALTGTNVESVIKGYLGTGYVTGFDNAGDAVEVTVNVEKAGNYDLIIRYSAPFGDKWNTLFVNGSNLGEQKFSQTNVFQDTHIGSIPLNAGDNKLRIGTSWGWMHLDAFLLKGIDNTPPLTEASVQGQQQNGWFSGDAVVSLSATDDFSGVKTTEYSTDGGTGWTAYAVPFTITDEGVHTMLYRSTDAAGNVEQTRTMTLSIDKTPPAYTVTANGRPFTEGASYYDFLPIWLRVQTTDVLSGAAQTDIAVDGAAHPNKAALDFAGNLGSHTVTVVATDNAGNRAERQISFTIKTDISSMRALIVRYAITGDLKKPLLTRLTNSLDQAEQQLHKGHPKQAVKHMNDFVGQLTKDGMERYVSPAAKASLGADANWLIGQWQQ